MAFIYKCSNLLTAHFAENCILKGPADNPPPPSGRFVKQEQTGTLRRQAEIGVRVQAPGAASKGSGCITPRKILRLHNAKSYNQLYLARKWFAMLSIMRS